MKVNIYLYFIIGACIIKVFGEEQADIKRGLLTPQQTVGAVYMPLGPETGPHWNLYKRSNPEAEDALYRILEKDNLNELHPATIRILGFIGDKDDADYLEALILNKYKGFLTPYMNESARAIFESLGIMKGRGVDNAERILNRMMNPDYWRGAEFRWFTDDIKAKPGFVYESISRALHGYAMSRPNDLDVKVGGVLNEINNAELKKYMEWRIDPDRLMKFSESALLYADQPLTTWQREKLNMFNIKKTNSGLPAESPHVDRTNGLQGNDATTDASNEERKTGAVKGQITSSDETEEVVDLANEAITQYKEIKAQISAGEFEEVAGRLLDNGEPLKDDKAGKSPELRQGMAMEQRIFKSLDQVQTTPADFEIERNIQYTFSSFEEKGVSQDVRMHEVVTFMFELQGSAEAERKLFEKHHGSLTVANDGTLIVVMKKIDGKWYWNPFGW